MDKAAAILASISKGIGAIAILTILFMILPFNVSLPVEIVEFFETGPIHKIVSFGGYLFPMHFVVTSFIFLLSLKYFGIFMNIISWIYHKVVG